MAEDKSTAAKALAAIAEKESKLQAEIALLRKEKAEHQQARLREMAAEAGGICDRVFKSLHSGPIAKDVDELRALSEEIMALDGKAYQRLTGDGYGAESPSVGFYGKFVFEALCNGRGLADILPKAWAHSENPYRTP